MPEAALTENASHNTGRKRATDLSGTCGATPRIRRSITALPPARNPMPMVWSVMMAGNANMDSEPRILAERAVFDEGQECVHGPIAGRCMTCIDYSYDSRSGAMAPQDWDCTLFDHLVHGGE